VAEPLTSEVIRYLKEVCTLFSDRLGASAVSQSVDGRRGGRVSPEAAGASRWWEFVVLRVGIATNVGGSVYIVERHDVKDFRRKWYPRGSRYPYSLE
jgi:hypothetical protein